MNLIEDKTAQKRALHVLEENQRVLVAGKALKQGDLLEFGLLMNASHQSLKNRNSLCRHQLLVHISGRSRFAIHLRDRHHLLR